MVSRDHDDSNAGGVELLDGFRRRRLDTIHHRNQTGGTAVNAKATAPDELRGAEIAGGETRQLKKGDVMIVPAGVPHWFKDVSNPFLYCVVKAR